jgi:hypothetical protein
MSEFGDALIDMCNEAEDQAEVLECLLGSAVAIAAMCGVTREQFDAMATVCFATARDALAVELPEPIPDRTKN